VPVHFIGGLPVEDMNMRHEVPVGCGSQIIRIGAPIFDDDLRAKSQEECRKHITNAINDLLKPEEEVPLPPDSKFAALVDDWVQLTDASFMSAILLHCFDVYLRAHSLEGAPIAKQSHELLQSFVDVATRFRVGDSSAALFVPLTPIGQWFSTLARSLYGPRGPACRKR
jgi:hypothetical protein